MPTLPESVSHKASSAWNLVGRRSVSATLLTLLLWRMRGRGSRRHNVPGGTPRQLRHTETPSVALAYGIFASVSETETVFIYLQNELEVNSQCNILCAERQREISQSTEAISDNG